ncbi:hypothetical protein HK098_005966 [Nowakowskiella sp. JEL0407]|nr:hypothetical protein HK098_005966 [Nowakowskiella sp. JEL0407]
MEQKTKVFADIELPSGILPVDVIADYLAFLFEVIQQEVSSILRSEGISNPLNLDQYVYCFTGLFFSYILQLEKELRFSLVPVFWSLAQQNTMREAVFKAKMISNFDSKNLMFCEEAVAGLLSFINMPAFNLPLPCDVLVLDAGGGTVDLFQCKILANKDVAEVTQADGGFFGSTLVDRYFWDFIKNTIGPQAYDELWNNPTLRTSKVDFINIWDGIKRSFDENESVWADEMMGGYKHINLSWELCKVIPQHILDTLPSSGEIRLQKHHLKSFFDPAVQEITKMVINQLDASGKTSYNQLDALVMIGGFCNNQYLRDTILKHPKIAPRVKSVPNIPEPESAVVQGASWYAFDRGFVSERKSRFTLGIRVLRPFNQWKDRQIDVVNLNDPQREWKVNRGFSKFVEIGQSVSYGSVYTQTVQIFKGVQRANVEILKSDKLKDVTDMDEGGVTSAGQFNIDVSEWLYTCPKWNRLSLTVNIEFGELELWVKVLPVLQAGQYMSEQELESVAIRTTMKIDEVRLELYSASQPRSNLSKIPSYSADEFNLVVLELSVNETSKKKAKRFDQLVADAIKACDNPLFKAAFLSTVIYEYLFPITNKPYDAAEKLAAVEDRLWKVLMSLEKLVKSRRGKNFESQLNELSPLLNGFEFVVKKGSINIFSKIYRRIVGDEVANALIDVFRRNPKSFATGAPMTSAIGMVNDRDEEPYDSDSLAVSQGSIRENGSLINVSQNSLNTSSSASLDERSSAYSNWSSGSQSSKSSKFDHLNAEFRSKVLGLQKDRFPTCSEPCKQRKNYHDIFISYRREPRSEIARDWLSLALRMINDRRSKSDRLFHYFVDVDCLEDGQPFTEQFLEALLHAKVIFLLITEETLNQFRASGDNVILEWEWALHLRKLHSQQKFRIQPLFIGNVDPVKDFDFNAVKVRLQSANNDLTQKHPLELSPQELSFKEVFDAIFALNGQAVDFTRRNFMK